MRWRLFELNPDIPLEGIDRRAYLEAKFGVQARGAALQVVRAAGKGTGIVFESGSNACRTRDAQQLIEWVRSAATLAAGRAPVRRVLHRRPRCGDARPARLAVAEVGHDARDARAMLDSEANNVEVADGLRWAQDVGIGGVPFFIFGGRYAVSGAQVPELLAQAIAKASEAGAV